MQIFMVINQALALPSYVFSRHSTIIHEPRRRAKAFVSQQELYSKADLDEYFAGALQSTPSDTKSSRARDQSGSRLEPLPRRRSSTG
ncbi:hypothetical protein CYMTET_24615 [Cymbomonas tetramitiformis]|uniref:Uncharacterized protein n=1 Tax=Cymbomonas tetramitiformis TaxID=36881 RepID=A0AAE0FVY8_9CHLO|nr:hypothetical protein CYMTET_24615 [Cymbomonas tetramitiformis]